MPHAINDHTANDVLTLNIDLSTSRPCAVTPFLFSLLLIKIIPMMQITNTIDILSMKGISKIPAAFALEKPTW